MKIEPKHGKLAEESCDLVIFPVYKGAAIKLATFADFIKKENFEGKMGEWIVFPTFGKFPARKIGLLGMGERAKFDLDTLRKVGGSMVRRASEARAKKVCIVVPGKESKLPIKELAQALVEGLMLSDYRFHRYKAKFLEQAQKDHVDQVTIIEEERNKLDALKQGIELGLAFAEATVLARDLVNMPAGIMTPLELCEVAKKVAEAPGISIKILSKSEMEKMGMHATLAVGRGSVNPPIGVHLTYKPRGAKKKIALIGKAVTFDSGGLSLKPSDGMMTMKIDMAGAAAIVGLFQLLPKLKPKVEVHGVFLAVENMPSGSAYRPGDVVKAMNGVTIEVLNTDAEGRLTLADALSYAHMHIKPDAMIDLATLTGAAVVALGEDMAGYMGTDHRLLDKIKEAAKKAGEDAWELPLHTPYEELIRSKVADIKNIGGGRGAGTITAGLFLSHFVGDIPWVHMDIAGPVFTEKEVRPDQPVGATGYGVRTLARYLQAQ